MATIKIDELKMDAKDCEVLALEETEAVKGGKGKQEVYLTYKLENVLVSSYS